MGFLLNKWMDTVDTVHAALNFTAPAGFLSLRIWIAWQFFKSGLIKYQSFDTTLFLFSSEYNVPLLPPVIAAYMATAAELILPVLLTLGLAGRISALGLFILNVMAVISYTDARFVDHLPWGLVLLVFVLHGPDKLSLDWLFSRFVLARK